MTTYQMQLIAAHRESLYIGAKRALYEARLMRMCFGPTPANVRALACAEAMVRACGGVATELMR